MESENNMRTTKKPIEDAEARWHTGSGNVFADLGVPDSEVALLKAQVAIAIELAIERKGITQREAGEIMGIPSSKVSNIVCGRVRGYSLDRLFTYLRRLDVDIEVKMSEKPKRKVEAEIRGVYV